jgi:uncharacterized protein YqeY
MTIKNKIIELRNLNNSLRTLLGTVLGELDRITKDPTDEQCIQVIKKMIDSLYLVNGNKEKEEAFILSQFLPSQLSDLEIKLIINNSKFSSIKQCMTFFKDTYAGLYDGKLVSKLFNESLKL